MQSRLPWNSSAGCLHSRAGYVCTLKCALWLTLMLHVASVWLAMCLPIDCNTCCLPYWQTGCQSDVHCFTLSCCNHRWESVNASTRACTHMYTYANAFTSSHTHIHIHTHVLTHTQHMRIHIHMHSQQAHTHTRASACIQFAHIYWRIVTPSQPYRRRFQNASHISVSLWRYYQYEGVCASRSKNILSSFNAFGFV